MPWQEAQASPKGEVIVKAWAAVDSVSWQLRQAAPMGSMGLKNSRGAGVASKLAGKGTV